MRAAGSPRNRARSSRSRSTNRARSARVRIAGTAPSWDECAGQGVCSPGRSCRRLTRRLTGHDGRGRSLACLTRRGYTSGTRQDPKPQVIAVHSKPAMRPLTCNSSTVKQDEPGLRGACRTALPACVSSSIRCLLSPAIPAVWEPRAGMTACLTGPSLGSRRHRRAGRRAVRRQLPWPSCRPDTPRPVMTSTPADALCAIGLPG